MRAMVVPTVTAYDLDEYRRQINAVKGFAKRIHIDLMDGEFAPTMSPYLMDIWWPHELQADIHLMYQRPMEWVDELVRLKPRMVIIHNEVTVHHMHFAAEMHKHDIKTGLAILAETPIDWAAQIMHSFDQVLIFSGHLGYHGGEADLNLLKKVRFVRDHHPSAEIAWDGGINEHNARALVDAGVKVLNVGGYIQKANDPDKAYATLKEVIKDDK